MIKLNRPTCPNTAALATNYSHQDIKKALTDSCFGKCMYCESEVTQVYFGDVEHIKPKSKFPELKFSWENLGFVCAKCNNAKADKYDDDTPHVNPYEDNPDDHLLAFGSQLRQKNGSERGEITITDIALNRLELLEKRQTRIEEIDKAVKACMRTSNVALRNAALDALKQEADIDKEYSLFAKTLLRLHGVI